MEFPDIPGYTVIELLGKGGMATIYLAEQINFQRKVALKVMSPHLLDDPTFGDRFLREARIVAKLTHPNFVPVYDVGRSGDYHYLSMEYLPGGNLQAKMLDGLPLQQGIRIIKEIANALSFADRHKFVHRDIKPENILLREDLSAVVCDLGIAKNIESETQMTQLGAVIGTPNYMSPEQARGAHLDGRSDLYSLGVIFYEMLAGQVPYRGDSAISTAIMHINSPIPRLPANFSIFQPFIDRALAKRPENRFESGIDMIDALEDIEQEYYEMINEAATTVLLHPEGTSSGRRGGLHRTWSGQSRSGFRSSGGQRESAIRRVRPSITEAARTRTTRRRKGVMALSLAAIVGIGAGGWWLYNQNSRESVYPVSTPSAAGSNMTLKLDELRAKAMLAMDQGRLYGEGDNNAQAYLTSLLVLAPDDQGGKSGISRLFAMYLEQAGKALEAGDFAVSRDTLNQASHISFYIENRALVEQQMELQRALSGAQKQSLIAAQRSQLIAELLADAQKSIEKGNLTSPVRANAYDRYQEVLSVDPDNAAARKGISDIAGNLLGQAREQMEEGEFGRAQALINAAVLVFPQHPQLASTSDQLISKEAAAADRLLAVEKTRSDEQEAQRLALEEKRNAKLPRIRSLLEGAQADLQAGRLDAPTDNNAIHKYKEVLDLDPANIEALHGFESIANQYIDTAARMIQSGDLDKAGNSLTQAKMLSPANPRYAQVQAALINARDLAEQQAAEQRERQVQISSLLRASREAITNGNIYLPRGNNALESLRQVLELDSGNAEAIKLRDKLLQQVINSARSDIGQRRFTDALLAIAALESSAANTRVVAGLRENFKAEKAQVALEEASRVKANEKRLALEAAARKAEEDRLANARQQDLAGGGQLAESDAPDRSLENERLARIAKEAELARQQAQQSTVSAAEKLLAKARGMGRIGSGNYRQLAELHAQVLKIDPSNAAARTGLARAADYSASVARQSIENRDYEAAASEMDYLQGISPNSTLLGPLQEALAYAQRQQSQASEILAAADAMTATPYTKPGFLQNNNEARQALKSAFDKIQGARQVDPAAPALAASEQKLLTKYIGIIEIHLDDGDADEALEFIDDLRATGLGGATLVSLEQKVAGLKQVKKKKTISVGSF